MIGPTGAFVLLPSTSRVRSLARDADRLHHVAEVTRNALCDHLTWVPFLDALVVTAGDLVRSADITVAPLDLLAVVLTEGPEAITASTLLAVRRALDEGRLDEWLPIAAAIEADARIDLCDPAEATARR